MKKNQKIKEGLDSIGYNLDYYMGKENNWKSLKELAEHFKLNWLDLCTEKNFNTRYRYSSKNCKILLYCSNVEHYKCSIIEQYE